MFTPTSRRNTTNGGKYHNGGNLLNIELDREMSKSTSFDSMPWHTILSLNYVKFLLYFNIFTPTYTHPDYILALNFQTPCLFGVAVYWEL